MFRDKEKQIDKGGEVGKRTGKSHRGCSTVGDVM